MWSLIIRVPNQILLVQLKQGGQGHVGLKRKEMRIVSFWKCEGKIPWCLVGGLY